MDTDLIKTLDEPPIFGEIVLTYNLEPVSLQAKTEKKKALKNAILQRFNRLNYYLSGEVQLDIKWYVHEKSRYEGADSPDIDNIIKPILDGLSGKEGLLIDDCQIQCVSSSWIDWTKQDNSIVVTVKYHSDEYVRKDDLIFVEINNNLYFPLQKNTNTVSQKIIIKNLRKMFALKERLEKSTNDYYLSKNVLPIQRLFHKSRIQGFNLLAFKNWEKEINKN